MLCVPAIAGYCVNQQKVEIGTEFLDISL